MINVLKRFFQMILMPICLIVLGLTVLLWPIIFIITGNVNTIDNVESFFTKLIFEKLETKPKMKDKFTLND